MGMTTVHGPFTVSRARVATGIRVEAGDAVQVTGRGLLDLGGAFLGFGAPILAADGDDWRTPEDYPAPHLRKNSLIWRVGGTWFQGGHRSPPVIECPTDGEIELFVNDSNPADNSRGWTVSVRVITPRPSDIDPCYERLGGASGFLGAPTSAEGWTEGFGGRYRHFAGGSLLWSPETGCHEVHGAIRQLYESLGWERGFLGYPVTDETPTPDGVGRFNHFQGGSIYWSPRTGAHEIHGDIRERWKELGWERSTLGYPVTSERATRWDPLARYNNFERGAIYWSRETGAWALDEPILAAWLADPAAAGFPTSNQGRTGDGRGQYAHFQRATFLWMSELGAWAVPDPIRQVYRHQGWEQGPLGYPVGPARRPSSAGGSSEFVLFQGFQHGGICVSGAGIRIVASEADCGPTPTPVPSGGGGGGGARTGTLTLRLAPDLRSIQSIDGDRSEWLLNGPRRPVPAAANQGMEAPGILVARLPFDPGQGAGAQSWTVRCRAWVRYRNVFTGVEGETQVDAILPLRPGDVRSTDYPVPFDWSAEANPTITFTVVHDPGDGTRQPAVGFIPTLS